MKNKKLTQIIAAGILGSGLAGCVMHGSPGQMAEEIPKMPRKFFDSAFGDGTVKFDQKKQQEKQEGEDYAYIGEMYNLDNGELVIKFKFLNPESISKLWDYGKRKSPSEKGYLVTYEKNGEKISYVLDK